jgi:hypothetical protein
MPERMPERRDDFRHLSGIAFGVVEAIIWVNRGEREEKTVDSAIDGEPDRVLSLLPPAVVLRERLAQVEEEAKVLRKLLRLRLQREHEQQERGQQQQVG